MVQDIKSDTITIPSNDLVGTSSDIVLNVTDQNVDANSITSITVISDSSNFAVGDTIEFNKAGVDNTRSENLIFTIGPQHVVGAGTHRYSNREHLNTKDNVNWGDHNFCTYDIQTSVCSPSEPDKECTCGYIEISLNSNNIKTPQNIKSSDGAFAIKYTDGSLYTWGDNDYGGDKNNNVNGINALSNIASPSDNRYFIGAVANPNTTPNEQTIGEYISEGTANIAGVISNKYGFVGWSENYLQLDGSYIGGHIISWGGGDDEESRKLTSNKGLITSILDKNGNINTLPNALKGFIVSHANTYNRENTWEGTEDGVGDDTLYDFNGGDDRQCGQNARDVFKNPANSGNRNDLGTTSNKWGDNSEGSLCNLQISSVGASSGEATYLRVNIKINLYSGLIEEIDLFCSGWDM